MVLPSRRRLSTRAPDFDSLRHVFIIIIIEQTNKWLLLHHQPHFLQPVSRACTWHVCFCSSVAHTHAHRVRNHTLRQSIKLPWPLQRLTDLPGPGCGAACHTSTCQRPEMTHTQLSNQPAYAPRRMSVMGGGSDTPLQESSQGL